MCTAATAGEILDTEIEISGDMLISVDVVKAKSPRWTVIETAEMRCTHGTSDSNLNEALRNAQSCHPCPGLVIARMSIPKISVYSTPFRKR
jgi:amidase